MSAVNHGSTNSRFQLQLQCVSVTSPAPPSTHSFSDHYSLSASSSTPVTTTLAAPTVRATHTPSTPLASEHTVVQSHILPAPMLHTTVPHNDAKHASHLTYEPPVLSTTSPWAMQTKTLSSVPTHPFAVLSAVPITSYDKGSLRGGSDVNFEEVSVSGIGGGKQRARGVGALGVVLCV